MKPSGIPANYHCTVTGVTFPTIYRIHHPVAVRGLPGVHSSIVHSHEFNLAAVSQHGVTGSVPEFRVDEVRRLGPGAGVDLHLNRFDSQDKAAGFLLAVKYLQEDSPAYPSQIATEHGFFVLMAVKSEKSKNRVFFNVFKDGQDLPSQAVFNQNGECVRHPSDC